MKRLSSTTIFLCSCSRRLFTRTTAPLLFNYAGETFVGIAHFSTPSSDSSSSSSYHSSSRRNPEEARNVRVSVWWDFENCQVPCNVNVFKITQCITAAVRTVGIKGPIQITAFGDVLQLSRSKQEALSSTGINLIHIPHGGKNSADRSLLVDLMYWVSQNPPPAHLLLISGDRDFASILHRLRMNNYNILLASTDNAPAVLCSAASIMWQWNSLVKGESLNGKHFNQPPDGPYASWYGHYRVPLEDPFAVCNQVSNHMPDEVSDSNSEPKPRPIPKAVMSVIRNILNSYPKGLAITDLRAELGKSNVTVEKDLYGHRKFSRFLLAMPNLLRLQSCKDGQFIVHGISPKSRETYVPTPTTTTKDAVPVSSKEEALPSSSTKLNDEKPSTDTQELRTKHEEPLQIQEQPPVVDKEKEGEVKLGQLYPVKMDTLRAKVGGLKSLWRKWFKGNDGHQEKICHTDKTVNVYVNTVPSKDQSSDQGNASLSSLSTNEVTQDAEIGVKSAENVDKDSKAREVFNRIVRWCKSWGRDKNTDSLNVGFNKSDKEISSNSVVQEIFTESFWNELLAFLETSKGSASILQSRSRQEMVENLQKFGPSQLQSLSGKHILQLVDLLISEKKWVVETPLQTFPFRFIGPSRGISSSKPNNSKESTMLPAKKKISPRNRSQILTDCQKLVNEVVKQHPDGFKISCFKKLFLEKYGYNLEVQQLGYQKLANLLQIMPGVKLESNCTYPSGDCSIGFPLENAGPANSPKSDNDTEWEELGPIAQNKTKKDGGFETVSDNDLSDSDSESSPTGSQNQRRKEGESTLLQILDSWYSNKEDSNSRITSDGSVTNMDYLNNNIMQKPSKQYSFVADKPEDDRENLTNDILNGLKKSQNGSSESKIQG